MSSQAREKSALTNDVQICEIPLATTVALFLQVLAMLLWLQLYLCAVMMKYEVCAVIV